MSNAILGVVDWDRDYKHCLKVNPSTHLNDVLAHFNKHSHKAFYIDDINIVKIQKGKGSIKLNGFYSNFHIYNYILFRNDNNTNYYYGFIDSLDYEAEKTTTINFSIDTWQMFSGSLSLKRSFIERMHIKKSDDTIGRWLAPEPVNFPKQYENVLQSCSTNFNPGFLVESVSRPTVTKFEYGGQALGGEMDKYTPLYGYKATSPDQIRQILENFEPDLTQLNFIDHRQDVIGCFLVPTFIFNQLQNGTTVNVPVAGDETITATENLNLNVDTLACGYVPKNNKMFTSLAKQYTLCNRNGFSVDLLPELFTQNTLLLEFSGRGFDNDNIKLVVGNYRFYSKNTFLLPYSGSYSICYNENSGITKQLNVIKSVVGGVTGGGSIPNIVGSAENIFNTAFGESGNKLGSSTGDYLSLTNKFFRPRLIDKSPLYDQCREIDNYLSTYGYSIQEFVQPSISNRSNWNYIQGDVNFSCNALEDNKQELKNIFKNGVTVWQNPLTMLDYSQENN